MPGRVVRTHTAARVAEILASKRGRAHLEEYGWVQGMPIIMAQACESVEDVMGLASIHGRAVLVAMIDPQTDDLCMLHLSMPNPALRIEEALARTLRISDLMTQAKAGHALVLRISHWKYSAVAHRLPAGPRHTPGSFSATRRVYASA